jgi:hypothetical protein
MSAWTGRVGRSLRRQAFNRAIGTEHAAVSRFGPKQGPATFAFIEPKTGVGRHSLFLDVSTFETGDARLQFDRTHRHYHGITRIYRILTNKTRTIMLMTVFEWGS